jgi:hypothetical protein
MMTGDEVGKKAANPRQAVPQEYAHRGNHVELNWKPRENAYSDKFPTIKLGYHSPLPPDPLNHGINPLVFRSVKKPVPATG